MAAHPTEFKVDALGSDYTFDVWRAAGNDEWTTVAVADVVPLPDVQLFAKTVQTQQWGIKIFKLEAARNNWQAEVAASQTAFTILQDRHCTIRTFQGQTGFRIQHHTNFKLHTHDGVETMPDLYCILQLACGTDFKKMKLPAPQACIAVFKQAQVQLWAALDLLHTAGYAYQDTKAANVVVCETEPADQQFKMIDFGLMQHLTDVTAPFELFVADTRYPDPEIVEVQRLVETRIQQATVLSKEDRYICINKANDYYMMIDCLVEKLDDYFMNKDFKFNPIRKLILATMMANIIAFIKEHL